MRYHEIITESFVINKENEDMIYDIFQKSYSETTGAAWTLEKFLSRARGWVFYGDENGFVAVREQRSGPKKLVGVAGDLRSILKGLTELQAEGGAVWGAVSEPLAKMAKKRGMIVPHTFFGGAFLVRSLMSVIPDNVFGGTKPEVQKDGGIKISYPDIGDAIKYLIGNKAYFMYAMGLPQIAEKIKEIPGLRTTLKLMGL